MRQSASKLTSKYQATIPRDVRKVLGLRQGDVIAFEIGKNKQITVKKMGKDDLSYTKALQKTLTEWESESDEEAYRDL